MGAGAPAPAQERDPPSPIKKRREVGHPISRRFGDRGDRQQIRRRRSLRLGRLHQGDVAGNDDNGYALLADRRTDGDFQEARHLSGAGDELAEMAALLEQRLGMGLLEIAGADLAGGDVRGDRKHREA